MKKLISLLITVIATVGCSISMDTPSGIVYTPEIVFIVEGCDPSDWNYDETEYNCREAYYTVELCDPYDYHYRPGCWEYWEVDQEFYNCVETHYCFMEPN